MAFFEGDKHINKGKELHQDMKSIKGIGVKKDTMMKVEKELRSSVLKPSGLSKKEAIEKIKNLERSGEIDHHSSYKLQQKFKKAA